MPSPSSRLIWALAAVAAALAQPAAQPPASVDGEVRDSVTGAPVERAHVAVRRVDSGSPERYGTFTNAEGKFTITGIPAGSYAYTLDRVGFVTISSGPTGGLTLQPGEKRENVKLKLTATGAIIGRVIDADGAPMEGIAVIAEAGGRTARSATTNDRGMFRIGGLRPGKFYVKARPRNLRFPPEIRTDGTVEVHYATSYYPSAMDARSAIRVEVGPAAEVTGVDIRLIRRPLVHIAGKISGIPPGAQNIFVLLRPQGMVAQARPDGSFELWGPDPGNYTICANASQPASRLTSAPIPLQIGQSDIEHVELQLIAAADIQGHVEFEDEGVRTPAPPNPAGGLRPGISETTVRERPQVQPGRVLLRSADGSDNSSQSMLNEDGSFTLNGVAAGKYYVTIAGGAIYVKSMRLGPAVFEGSLLDLTNGAGRAPLTLRVASAEGVISGLLRDDKGPLAGARVALMEDSTERVPLRLSVSKEDGSYSFIRIPPGNYKVFALDDSQMSSIDEGRLEEFDDIGETIQVHGRETVRKDLKKKQP